ncbi:MAG: AI-2E family transporter [Leadbetterella sp.]|nr:AI-2E family transporter [Leadbetterella sp.]
MQKRQISNHAINQIMLITVIVVVCLFIFRYLSYYLPGFLGAITLYILFRGPYIRLTLGKKWNRILTSLLFIFLSIVFIVLPIWALIDYLIPRISSFLSNTEEIVVKFNQVKEFIRNKPLLQHIDLSDEALVQFLQSLTKYLPKVLNSVAEVLINMVVTFFVLYFMLVHGKQMETTIKSFFPFSNQSRDELWTEINLMVRTNAIGIPILGICQGLVAVIGYYIFGVQNALLWGIVTGVATVFPVLGTMIVYVPICIVSFATGELGNAIWLTLYCFFLVGGIDNILRFTILKTLGNVHPLITVFGVLFGLNLFGMLGLIFGPLIISSISVLFKVYRNEYGSRNRVLRGLEELTEESE